MNNILSFTNVFLKISKTQAKKKSERTFETPCTRNVSSMTDKRRLIDKFYDPSLFFDGKQVS